MQVADELPDMGPVLLLDVGPVVLVARARAGEGDFVRGAPGQEVGVDGLGPVVRVDAEDREREGGHDVLDDLETQMAALFLTLRLVVQPVAMSVTVSVQQNSPGELPPSRPTRSISTNPGTFSFHSAQIPPAPGSTFS